MFRIDAISLAKNCYCPLKSNTLNLFNTIPRSYYIAYSVLCGYSQSLKIHVLELIEVFFAFDSSLHRLLPALSIHTHTASHKLYVNTLLEFRDQISFKRIPMDSIIYEVHGQKAARTCVVHLLINSPHAQISS
jgi:hypothetical protein